jgi:hypothetical protein
MRDHSNESGARAPCVRSLATKTNSMLVLEGFERQLGKFSILLAGKGKRKGRERKGKRRRKERERKGKEKEKEERNRKRKREIHSKIRDGMND